VAQLQVCELEGFVSLQRVVSMLAATFWLSLLLHSTRRPMVLTELLQAAKHEACGMYIRGAQS
jgi:hypothetical protein